ncbi:MAG: serine/threonine-protein kinase HipA [Hyphomicrobiales bacterium]|jgi:serine/threonine-protein kinase HipA|nr:serine/threonine-protein kinase HipA [Hyphomicrobiales bacterium]
MPDVSVLNVLLYGERIGTLTFLQGERTLFAFNDTYINNENRSTLSLSFKDGLGNLITELKPTRQRVPTFFANMLPEGEMREYLAKRAGVNPKREFFLLWILGKDLPGAVTIEPADGEAWPPDVNHGEKEEEKKERKTNALRFSLAGVQLKFSAIKSASGGLTIPAEGVGGSWIVKLPSTKFDDVPENEFSMMTLAGKIGMDVPEVQMIDPASISRLPDGIEALKGKALAVKRFDRTDGGPLHIEDFAQVFRLWPEEKYGRASYRNIAEVIAAETGNPGIAEFIRRLVFNNLIGNADMHAKNWSLIYPDRRKAAMAPAYDFVSTVPYISDDNSALSFGRTKRFDEFTNDELAYLAGKARLPEKLVLDTAGETVERFHQTWNAEKKNLPLSKKLVDAIEAQARKIPIARRAA